VRTCIFCGDRVSTAEDAWPLWLMERFLVSDKARTYGEIGARRLDAWVAPKPRLRLKKLCKDCNNGWMSKLESLAKPIFESILEEQLSTIDPPAQIILARWATKTAMVLEAIDSNRTWFYNETERRRMRETQTIPERTSVWIAKCVDSPNIYSAAKDLWSSPNKTGVHAFVTTMAFGFLALQVVGTDRAVLTYGVSDGPWDQTLIRVWPANQGTVSWPPKYGLNGELGLDALTERLNPEKRR
jgi:hypothetical protein